MKKVLVIDDDNDILGAVELVLEAHGFDTFVSTSADNVSSMIEEYQPDLIILDYLLSGADGSQICVTLKSNPATKNIPVILFSAHPSARDLVPQCGANSFVPKPFSVADLLGEVNQHLQGQSRL